MPSNLRHQLSFSSPLAVSTQVSQPQPPAKKQKKMTVTQTYRLAHTARGKLASEAQRGEHDLRLLVGHANLLDSLMLELRDAEREQEAWFDSTVSVAAGRDEPRHVQWRDRVVEEAGLESDSDDSDYEEEEEEEELVQISTASRRTKSPPPPVQRDFAIADDEDSDDEYDDDEDNSELTLTRTHSRSQTSPPSSPPELVNDLSDTSDESDEEEEEHDLEPQSVIAPDFSALLPSKPSLQSRKNPMIVGASHPPLIAAC